MNLDRLHSAFQQGDLLQIQAELGNPEDFPNTQWGDCGDLCLDYAIYHAPITLVRELLELGADPNYVSPDGFPSLFAALTAKQSDRALRLLLLLDFGADIQQRGANDYTPLHLAATNDDADSVFILLSRGADPLVKTRIDHYGTPFEEARRSGHAIGLDALRRAGITK